MVALLSPGQAMWCMEVFVGKIMSYSGDRLIDVDQPITGEVSRGGVRLGHGPYATNVVLGAALAVQCSGCHV